MYFDLSDKQLGDKRKILPSSGWNKYTLLPQQQLNALRDKYKKANGHGCRKNPVTWAHYLSANES